MRSFGIEDDQSTVSDVTPRSEPLDQIALDDANAVVRKLIDGFFAYRGHCIPLKYRRALFDGATVMDWNGMLVAPASGDCAICGIKRGDKKAVTEAALCVCCLLLCVQPLSRHDVVSGGVLETPF